jgi:hypothetical protein
MLASVSGGGHCRLEHRSMHFGFLLSVSLR